MLEQLLAWWLVNKLQSKVIKPADTNYTWTYCENSHRWKYTCKRTTFWPCQANLFFTSLNASNYPNKQRWWMYFFASLVVWSLLLDFPKRDGIQHGWTCVPLHTHSIWDSAPKIHHMCAFLCITFPVQTGFIPTLVQKYTFKCLHQTIDRPMYQNHFEC